MSELCVLLNTGCMWSPQLLKASLPTKPGLAPTDGTELVCHKEQ